MEHDGQHVLEHGLQCAWCQQCDTTCNADDKVCCKTDKVHAAMIRAQERHCHVSTEEAEGYASPANCWLMTPLPQEVMIGNLHPVAETATVAIAGVAAAACAADVAAAAAAAAAATAAAVRISL